MKSRLKNLPRSLLRSEADKILLHLVHVVYTLLSVCKLTESCSDRKTRGRGILPTTPCVVCFGSLLLGDVPSSALTKLLSVCAFFSGMTALLYLDINTNVAMSTKNSIHGELGMVCAPECGPGVVRSFG